MAGRVKALLLDVEQVAPHDRNAMWQGTRNRRFGLPLGWRQGPWILMC